MEHFAWAVAGVSVLVNVLLLSVVSFLFSVLKRRKDIEQELHSLAYTDKLLGIPSGNFAKEELTRRLSTLVPTLPPSNEERRGNGTKRHVRGRSVAFFYCDLDRFKEVNDTYGHDAGDRMLVAVANALSSNVRRGDVVARWLQGDEFAIIASDIDDTSASAMSAKLESAVSALSVEVVSGVCTYPSVSIGFSVTNLPMGAEVLVRQAEKKMYKQKKRRT